MMGKRSGLELQRRKDAIGLLSCEFGYSDPERAFLAVLQKAVGAKYDVLGKVKVLDVIAFPNKQKVTSLLTRKMLNNSVFDYLICDRQTREIVCVVELEERVVQKGLTLKWRRQQEKRIQNYCLRASLARLIVQQQSGYLLNQLIERFEDIILEETPACWN